MGFGGQGGVGSGMSSMRLVGPTGRDQSHVSTGDPSFRKGAGKAGGKGGIVGAGVGECGPKVPVSLDKELALGGTSVGCEGRGEGLPLLVGEVLSAGDKKLSKPWRFSGVFQERKWWPLLRIWCKGIFHLMFLPHLPISN